MCALVYYFVNTSHSKFKLRLHSNEFAFYKRFEIEKHFLNSKPALGHFLFPSQTGPAWPPLLSPVCGPATGPTKAQCTSRHRGLSMPPGANPDRQPAKQRSDLLGPKLDPQPEFLPIRATSSNRVYPLLILSPMAQVCFYLTLESDRTPCALCPGTKSTINSPRDSSNFHPQI
jgi:hypothetical protein